MSSNLDKATKCWWCGAKAGRPLNGPDWHCNSCGKWQNYGPCPCCGNDVPLTRSIRASWLERCAIFDVEFPAQVYAPMTAGDAGAMAVRRFGQTLKKLAGQ
jgi:hypothetical protein